jgi:hypothetical protein
MGNCQIGKSGWLFAQGLTPSVDGRPNFSRSLESDPPKSGKLISIRPMPRALSRRFSGQLPGERSGS